jgi:hypothetical protein
MLAVQRVTALYVYSFVFLPSCHRFLSDVVWSLRFPGDDEACLWRSGEASTACTTMVHCERTADWFQDGTLAVQTRGARRGERGEHKILCCVQTERPP